MVWPKKFDYFLRRRSRQRKHLSASMLSMSVAKMGKNAIFSKTKQLELWSLLTTYRKFYMGFSKKPLLDP